MLIPSGGSLLLGIWRSRCCWSGMALDYLNAILVVSEGGCSPVPSGRMIVVREGLHEGLQLWEWLECLLGKWLDLCLLSRRLCLDLDSSRVICQSIWMIWLGCHGRVTGVFGCIYTGHCSGSVCCNYSTLYLEPGIC